MYAPSTTMSTKPTPRVRLKVIMEDSSILLLFVKIDDNRSVMKDAIKPSAITPAMIRPARTSWKPVGK